MHGKNKMNTSLITRKTLYDEDFNLWLETTIEQIQQRNFDSIEWENVLEELEGLGKQQKQELENRLIVLLEHLLKLIYWKTEKEYNARGWIGTIVEQRRQILRLLKNNPSLKLYLSECFNSCYDDARAIAIAKTGLNADVFPNVFNISLTQILDNNWLPD